MKETKYVWLFVLVAVAVTELYCWWAYWWCPIGGRISEPVDENYVFKVNQIAPTRSNGLVENHSSTLKDKLHQYEKARQKD